VRGRSLLLPLLAAALPTLVACFSSKSPAASLPDASAGPQSAGQTCDPAAAEPCFPTGDPCVGVACDPNLLVCVEFDTDGGALCSANGAPCATSADCATGLTCGFPVPAAGAANACSASGQCVNPPLACEDDASSCGSQAPACGCDGEPDPFVVPGFATSPVASLTPCPDGGPIIDAGVDSSAPDASDAAPP
jgi:hypothetical protein